MRLALLADIHGNLPALEAIVKELKNDTPYGILVAGDWTAGPWGRECLETLETHMETSVLGNTDIRLLKFVDGKAPGNWSHLKQFGLARWDTSHLDERHLDLLRSLPEQRTFHPDGTAPIRIVHGSLESACGHTHRPMALEKDGKLIVNPGAVSGPLNGDIRAQYALLEWQAGHWQAEFRGVDYDKEKLIEGFESSGLLEGGGALARSFLYTELTGEDITLLFFQHIDRIAESRAVQLDTYVPDEIWEEAERSFDWQAIEKRRHD